VPGRSQPPREVFPLAPRLHYVYAYASSWYTADELVSSGVSDSGTVRYVVLDSTLAGDTAVAWRVMEYRDLLRRENGSMPALDTSYWVADSALITLVERTDGYHELRASGTVWRFPFAPARDTVYRYADSARVTLARFIPGSFPMYSSAGDTMRFSDSAGLYQGHFVSSMHYAYIVSMAETRYELRGLPTAVAAAAREFPGAFSLLQNFPNPFNPATTIRYRIAERTSVRLTVADALGRQVALLADGIEDPGEKAVVFDARGLASGVYYCRLLAGGASATRALLLLR
jgi:hypothetical protein